MSHHCSQRATTAPIPIPINITSDIRLTFLAICDSDIRYLSQTFNYSIVWLCVLKKTRRFYKNFEGFGGIFQTHHSWGQATLIIALTEKLKQTFHSCILEKNCLCKRNYIFIAVRTNSLQKLRKKFIWQQWQDCREYHNLLWINQDDEISYNSLFYCGFESPIQRVIIGQALIVLRTWLSES